MKSCPYCGMQYDSNSCPKCGGKYRANFGLIKQKKSDVAFLVYSPLYRRRKNNSLKGNDSVGVSFIVDILKREGIEVGYCTAENADNYRIVLVSITSTYDYYSFYQSVALKENWQSGKRKFKVIGGGFALKNPFTIRNYIDYAVFGRGENIIVDLVKFVLGNGIKFDHPSVMNLPEIYPVVMAQVDCLYPNKVKLESGKIFEEKFIGCHRKCKFCDYTWSRKHIGTEVYYQDSVIGSGKSVEVTWDQIIKWPKKIGRIRTAIDGVSEKLRYTYGKQISNQDIIDGIRHVSSFGGRSILMIYNISGFPKENEEDWKELYSTFEKCGLKEGEVFIYFHSTPFRPAIPTPMEYCPVTFYPSTGELAAKTFFKSDKLWAVHSPYNSGVWPQFQMMIVKRASIETDKIFHEICFSPEFKKGKAKEKLERALSNFDCSQYVRQYEFDEKNPTWFLNSYTPKEKLIRIAKKIRKEIN